MFRSCASSKFVNVEGKHAGMRARRLLARMERVANERGNFQKGKQWER